MNDYEIVFESENICYVKVNEKLIDDYLEMINDPEVASKISHNVRTYTHEGELKWINEKLQSNALVFSMIDKKTGEYIGNIEISTLWNRSNESNYKIWI